MGFKLSSKSKQRREGLDPELIRLDDYVITITPIDYGHGEGSGLRTAEYQNGLYIDGKSKCDGYSRISRHQSGRALDFYAFVDGKASWEPEHLAMIGAAYLQGAAFLGIRLKWGGLFKKFKTFPGKDYKAGWDMPHVELID